MSAAEMGTGLGDEMVVEQPAAVDMFALAAAARAREEAQKPAGDDGDGEGEGGADGKKKKKKEKKKAWDRLKDGSAGTSRKAVAKRLAAERYARNATDERLPRTLFVGNVPIATKEKEVRRLFSKHGKIESVRFRSFAIADPKTPRKAAFVNKEFHAQRETMNAYVVFAEEKAADAALCENGSLLGACHVRVDSADKNKSKSAKGVDSKRSVFLGNLPLDTEGEQLRTFFLTMGLGLENDDIDDVRLVRDRQTNIGKGFGFVSFSDERFVTAALTLQGAKFRGRELRVTRCKSKEAADKWKQKRLVALPKPGADRRIMQRGQKRARDEAEAEKKNRGHAGAASFEGKRAPKKPKLTHMSAAGKKLSKKKRKRVMERAAAAAARQETSAKPAAAAAAAAGEKKKKDTKKKKEKKEKKSKKEKKETKGKKEKKAKKEKKEKRSKKKTKESNE